MFNISTTSNTPAKCIEEPSPRGRYCYAVSASLLALFITATMCLSGCVNPETLPGIRDEALRRERQRTQETEQAIEKSPELRDLNAVCVGEVPLPDGFALVNKEKAIHIGTYLTYGYYSDADYPKVKDFYVTNLTQRGWKLTDQNDGGWGQIRVEFRKGSYEVTINHWRMHDRVNYKVRCEKLSAS